MLFQKDAQTKPFHQPSQARDVFDVSGAGDTVAGITSLALAAGCSLVEAVCIANTAAGIVVEKPGTYAVSEDELKSALVRGLPVSEKPAENANGNVRSWNSANSRAFARICAPELT